jgi:murein DD-endopeptidase MepM/ murein hydrolase activator NlpD
MRRTLVTAGAVAAAAVPLALPLAHADGKATQKQAQELQRKIDVTRGKVAKRRGTEQVLTSQVAAYTERIDALQGRIDGYESRQQVVQSELDGAQAKLDRLQTELRDERARLVRLKARLAEARRQLSDRLVELYTADSPDLVTVVLNSDGFNDLLERGEFLKRINDQDVSVMGVVKAAKADAAQAEARLTTLEGRQAELTAGVKARRDELARLKQGLVDTRVGYEQTKEGKAQALRTVRTQRVDLEDHLDDLEADQAKVKAALQKAMMRNELGGGGTGQLTIPASGPITGAFGEVRPGHIHAGIDIAMPIGTPLHAADGGKVVIAGVVSGYGNYTCIQHTASLSTCYGHQNSIGVSVGQTVKKGQVIGESGNTGHSTGPHLHFEVRVNGTPVNPLGYL